MLHLDPGGFANYFTETGPAKTAVIVRLYEEMGVDAVNVSARELANDADRFITLTRDRSIPFLSANIIDESTNEPVFAPTTSMVIDGKKIGIIGITQRVLKTWERGDGSRLVTIDPEIVLPGIVAALAREADYIILLAHIPRVRLEPLLEKAPGIDLVIGADGYSVTGEDSTVAGIPASYAGRQGQSVGHLRMRFGKEKLKVLEQKNVRLTTDMAEDADVARLVAGVLKGF